MLGESPYLSLFEDTLHYLTLGEVPRMGDFNPRTQSQQCQIHDFGDPLILQTINDVISGIIFFGVRLYMQEVSPKSSNAHSTSLVLLNTRMFRSCNSVEEMVKPNAKSPWGNHFAFLHVLIPKLNHVEFSNPLKFVWEAQKIIKRKRSRKGPLIKKHLDTRTVPLS